MTDIIARIPVYLPNGVVIGTAQLVTENQSVFLTIDIPLDPGVANLLEENLIGIHFSYLHQVAKDMIDPKKLNQKNPAGDISAEQFEELMPEEAKKAPSAIVEGEQHG